MKCIRTGELPQTSGHGRHCVPDLAGERHLNSWNQKAPKKSKSDVKTASKFLSKCCIGTYFMNYYGIDIILIFIKKWQDHAAAGIGAGTVAVLCMHPLDLLKVKFQVATTSQQVGVGKQIWISLKEIHQNEGWRGLYRGVSANIAGNASSWGLYFLLYVYFLYHYVLIHFISFTSYNMLKKRASPDGDPNTKLSSLTTLLYSAEASSQPQFYYFADLSDARLFSGAVTALMTNPIWVVKVRMFTTRRDSPTAYRGLWGSCLFCLPLFK